jgi:uncharacterized protein (TIGR02246 family)
LLLAALASALACAQGGHGAHAARAREGEQCHACAMHAEKHGSATAAAGEAATTGAHADHAADASASSAAGAGHTAKPGGMHGAMHGAMHGEGGMHAEHAARHAAIDRLVAIEEIQQLKARYMRCIDTKDLACLRDRVFTPDAVLSFHGGDYAIDVKGWAEIEKFYQGAFSPQKFGMHQVHTREIEVNGDAATGVWYLHDVFVNLEQSTTLQGSALYHDEYVKRDGAWRIAKSTYQRLWEETTPRDPRTKLGSKPVKE